MLLPWGLATVLFSPRGVYPVREGGWLARIATARSLAGLLIIIGAIVKFDPSALWRYPENTVNAASNTALIAIGVLLLVLLAAAVQVRGGQRLRAFRAMLRPLLTIALLVASIYALQSTRLISFGVEPPDAGYFGGSTGGQLTLNDFGFSILRNVASLWILVFFAVALVHISRSIYAVGDAHPKFTPLITVVLTLALLLIDLLGEFVPALQAILLEVNDPLLPSGVSLAIMAGGTASVIILCVLEFRQLGRDGWSLREGPWH